MTSKAVSATTSSMATPPMTSWPAARAPMILDGGAGIDTAD